MSQVDHVMSDPDAHGESSPRFERAEVARLALAVRAARREAEHLEREAEERTAAVQESEAFLRQSLDRLVSDRRERHRHELAEATAAAARTVAAARRAVGAGPPPTRSSRGDGGKDPGVGTNGRSEEHLRLRLVVDATGEVPALDETVAAPTAPWDGTEHPTLAGTAGRDRRAGAPSVPITATGPTAGISREELRDVVQAAVVAALAEATDRAVATMRMVPALAGHAVPGVPLDASRFAPTAQMIDVAEPSIWRRFAHLDVLLPLVAAVIVILLFFAWMG